MAVGPRDVSSLVMLTGWDATELQNHKLQDGTTYDAIVSTIGAAVGALNIELTSGLWGSLISFQDFPDVEYRVGSSNGMNEFTEYGRADSQRATTEGHMLPLKAWDRRLGWTWDYLRKARMTQIEADIQDGLKDVRDRWRIRILRRLLQRGDDSGANAGLGSSGYSPGFATTAASTSVDFDPPDNAGTSFDNTHEHYVAIAGGAFTNAVFSDAKAEIREHGHEPTYDFLIGPADETTVKGLSDFTSAPESNLVYGANTTLATLEDTADSIGSYYIGAIHDFNVRVVRGIPQYYGFAYKSYGTLSQRNPLRIQLSKGQGRPTVMAMSDPRAQGSANYPIQSLMLFLEFGVGVADRTNGTARYVNNATWADGTAT